MDGLFLISFFLNYVMCNY